MINLFGHGFKEGHGYEVPQVQRKNKRVYRPVTMTPPKMYT